MEYRQLGRSGLRVSARYTRHDDLRRARRVPCGGRDRRRWRAAAGRHVPGRRGQSHRYRGRLLGRSRRGDHRRGDHGPPGLAAAFHQGADADGRRPHDAGLSRHHIISGCEASLRLLGTDHIDIYHVHEWDGQTRLEETLFALDALVAAGKVRYLAASNFAGWQLMKALCVADAHGFERFAAQQVYYSLEARDAEYERSRCRSTRGSASSSGRRWPRPGVRQVPARRVTRKADQAAVRRAGTSRRSATRRSSTTRSRCSSTWRARTAPRPPRSRWPGCSAGPR